MIRALAAGALACSLGVWAADYDYRLQPEPIASDTYVLSGHNEDFSRQNGGNIANTAFIVTEDGVVVIDTGPSRRYGLQQRAAIAAVTDRPVVAVLNTHHHPDHFFGNQAYAGLPVYALGETIEHMQAEMAGFADNLYRLSGFWMQGTDPAAAGQAVPAEPLRFGRHTLRLFSMAGHTSGDLAIFDEHTGVLFTGDLVFNARAPTTPHADLEAWLVALDELQRVPFRLLVPGHGAVSADDAPIEQTRSYLRWLGAELERAAGAGVDMAEALLIPIPAEFAGLALVEREFPRSVAHLYPLLEQGHLPRIDD